MLLLFGVKYGLKLTEEPCVTGSSPVGATSPVPGVKKRKSSLQGLIFMAGLAFDSND